ncbi:MAG: hypothetical protein R3190_04445 [Thermoanaerobaculia bacterium]|nr:hypothetical protein [Thermoanaerobaculia bacterium]
MPRVAVLLLVVLLAVPTALGAERRDSIAHPRTPFRLAFYQRHRETYRMAGVLHFGHGKLHDVLQLRAFADHEKVDADFYDEILAMMARPPRVEPTQEYYAPYTARMAWRLFRTIDWTHALHEMTYDVMADARIPWPQKKASLDRAWEIYARERHRGIVMSPAPLDVTMRRAAVMMKPYFSLTRNYYPLANNFFYAAHWWHPATYEAMMTGGNGDRQVEHLLRIDQVFRGEVVADPPLRMILSREGMPRYSRLSPRTANAFDNLHMLHGIAYDICAYEGWTPAEKRAELYRVIDAMSYQPGDEAWARRFEIPRPDLDPLVYDEWLRSADGAMSRIMVEMLAEMMPAHGAGPGAGDHDHGHRHGDAPAAAAGPAADLEEQLRLKLTPGLQEGEIEGSFLDAMRRLMPGMEMAPDSERPGVVPAAMVEAMMAGWERRVATLDEVEPWPMPEPGAEAGR